MKKEIYVVGAVIAQNGKILVAQRPKGKSLPLMWEFPGGKIENGENAVDALKREITEELNVDIQVDEKITTASYEYEFGIVHLTTYDAKILSGQIELNAHVDYKWVSPQELNDLTMPPADIPTIELIIARENV